MPPQLGSSRLGKLQLMNSGHFTAGVNSTVPKSLVHARALTHRGSVQLRTARITSCGAEYRRFRNRLEYGTLIPPRAASGVGGVAFAVGARAQHLTCAHCNLVCDTIELRETQRKAARNL